MHDPVLNTRTGITRNDIWYLRTSSMSGVSRPDWNGNPDYIEDEGSVPVVPSYASNAAAMPIVATYQP